MSAFDEGALLWCDVETTGLDPRAGRILEVGLVLTDKFLVKLDERSWVVHFDRAELSNLSDFILKMHTTNGLLFEAMQSETTIQEVEQSAVRWAMSRVNVRAEIPMAGSTVSFDRAWLKHHAPAIDGLAHYRSFDVSTIKLASRLWYPDLPRFEDRATHRVLPDIEDSITELAYYRKAILRQNGRDIANGS